jgi:hypothetical protein
MKKPLIFLFSMTLLMHQFSFAASCPMSTGRIERIVDRTAWVWNLQEDHVVKIRDSEIDLNGHVGHLGPIESAQPRGRTICVTSEVDLVEQPFAYAGKKYFYFLSGDSITVQLKVIDLKSCAVVWQSAPYGRDNVPNIFPETSEIKLSKSTISIKESCLPTKPSFKQ